jgi:diacylglycerol kinase
MSATPLLPSPAETKRSRPRLSWRGKFHVALRGMKFGIRGHSSFAIHFFVAALVIAAGIVLHCNAVEWCLLVGCIGMVLTTELINSTIETLFACLDEAIRDKAWPCLDIAAGAVLMAALTAVVIGLIIFLPKLAALKLIS